MTIGLGILGLGQAGAMMVPVAARHEALRLVAAADSRQGVRDAFQQATGAPAYGSIEALYADPAVDLLYVATPTHLHTDHVLQAIAAGKHVIVEKPMAVTLDAATAMIASAARSGVHLIVGHSQSFEPPIRAMRDLVASGELGRLLMVNTWYFTDWLYRPRNPEELDTSLGGGVVFRQGAHQADLLRWIAGGMARSVRAHTTSADPARPAEGSHIIFADFDSGAAATAVFSGYDHFHSRDLTGGIDEAGRLAVSPPGSSRKAAGAGPDGARKSALGFSGPAAPAALHHGHYGLTVVSCERGDIRQSPNGLVVYSDTAARELAIPLAPAGRDNLLQEAIDAIHTGRPPAHDGAWGRANLEVCLAALESARTGQAVELLHQVAVP